MPSRELKRGLEGFGRRQGASDSLSISEGMRRALEGLDSIRSKTPCISLHFLSRQNRIPVFFPERGMGNLSGCLTSNMLNQYRGMDITSGASLLLNSVLFKD